MFVRQIPLGLAMAVFPLGIAAAPFDEIKNALPLVPDSSTSKQLLPDAADAADPSILATNSFAEALPEVEEAKRLLLARDVDGCLDQLQSAYAKQLNLPPPKLMLAQLLLSVRDFQPSRRLLEDVARSHPKHPELYLTFGKMAIAEGRAIDAALHFKEAMSLEPPQNWTDEQRDQLRAECLAGNTLVAQSRGDWATAAKLYQQQVNANPTNVMLRDRWATALFQDGRLEEAHEQFNIAHRRDPQQNPPEISMAVMHVRAREFNKAEEWFKKARTRYPDDPLVYFESSLALMRQDRAEEADKQCVKAAQLELDSDVFLMHRGQIATQLGKFDDAAEFFQIVLNRQPRHLGALTSLALAMAEHEDADKRLAALELMLSAASEHPDSLMVKSGLGRVQFRNGQLKEAEASFQAVAAKAPREPATLLFLSQVLMQQNRKDEAVRVARQLESVVDQPGIFSLRPTARRWLVQVLPQEEQAEIP